MDAERDIGTSGEGYWYDHADSITGVLTALREFRRAEQALRRRLSTEMGMNVTDLQALQHLIAAERDGLALTPRDLTAHLRISTASTTKLLDRLVASGHLARQPHPHDRRSVVIVPTEHAHEQVRERLTGMHERMREIAERVPPQARGPLVAFLREMAAHLESEASPPSLTPAS
ncbi:MarR family winged helix-turn-helix transcriptional regulator [Pseudactinotalea terrae]|uniref:MarR family winged helix-turn-helix transcriptional regulator n=1 Tax=Pseudactinotalea terrae TaxID=1743262 RepID=UPI0012E28A07|nr:MarR family winged helix-turn-helix transcriptional regulator [Pseudactinotalea terrae]